MSRIKMGFVHFKCIPKRISYGRFFHLVLLTYHRDFCKELKAEMSLCQGCLRKKQHFDLLGTQYILSYINFFKHL